MPDVYRLERASDYRDEYGPFYDATKNGAVLLARVRYPAGFDHIATLIQDDDHFQEVTDGKIDHEESGADLLRDLRKGY